MTTTTTTSNNKIIIIKKKKKVCPLHNCINKVPFSPWRILPDCQRSNGISQRILVLANSCQVMYSQQVTTTSFIIIF
jgi:hypothetical protein